jgi:hypothetical protein
MAKSVKKTSKGATKKTTEKVVKKVAPKTLDVRATKPFAWSFEGQTFQFSRGKTTQLPIKAKQDLAWYFKEGFIELVK